jgi:PEP-CTERM motif
MKKIRTLCGIAMLASSAAQAQVLFSDNFNSENGGNSALGYESFANWRAGGVVDLVKNGDFGVTCGGVCVNLGGRDGLPAQINGANFSFAAGDAFTVFFDVGGSQRSIAADNFFVVLVFRDPTSILGITGTGGFSGINAGPLTRFQYVTPFNLIAGATPLSTWSLTFTAGDAGSLFYSFNSSSADGVGPLLDNISIVRAANTTVPEPTTWALMLGGLGGLAGVTGRRKRGATAR